MSIDTFSRKNKEAYLRKLSEDDFRDKVVRPTFLRIGFKDGRDLCGPEEEGKDALFIEIDNFGKEQWIAVQTKKGNLNLASNPTNNILSCETQLRTCLSTSYALPHDKKKIRPSKAILVASGKINQRARDEIIKKLDGSIDFIDRDDLINIIDEKFPELWLGIEKSIAPYFSALRKIAIGSDLDPKLQSNFGIKQFLYGPYIGANYIDLQLYHFKPSVRKVSGEIFSEPKLIEIDARKIFQSSSKLIYIKGDAGSGKSTLLIKLALDLAGQEITSKGNCEIPVILRAKDLLKFDADEIVSAAVDKAMQLAGQDVPVFDVEDLVAGQVILMVDAIDEISKQKERCMLISGLLSLHQQYPKSRIVITSRPSAHISEIPQIQRFSDYTISAISWNQAKKLFNQVTKGKALPTSEASEFVRRLEQVYGLELSPLLVSVFAATSDYDRKDIPANITELFKQFTELLLGRWDQDRGLGQLYQGPLKDFILQQVAFDMHDRGVTAINDEEFRSIVERQLKNRGHDAVFEEMYSELVSRSGLFRKVGQNLEFRHHLLQEFFAGRAIPDQEFVTQKVCVDWWRRPIVFYFGENPDKVSSLLDLVTSLPFIDEGSQWESAITAGLALQACYLSDVDEKVELWEWVASTLSKTFLPMVEKQNDVDRYPCSSFTGLYMHARDAVALNHIGLYVSEIKSRMDKNTSDQTATSDYFWLIVALIETGHPNQAKELIKEFFPEDRRYLLSLSLGCFLCAHVRDAEADKRAAYIEIDKLISPKIIDLKRETVKEFGSMLLELRNGKIMSLENDGAKTNNGD